MCTGFCPHWSEVVGSNHHLALFIITQTSFTITHNNTNAKCYCNIRYTLSAFMANAYSMIVTITTGGGGGGDRSEPPCLLLLCIQFCHSVMSKKLCTCVIYYIDSVLPWNECEYACVSTCTRKSISIAKSPTTVAYRLNIRCI